MLGGGAMTDSAGTLRSAEVPRAHAARGYEKLKPSTCTWLKNIELPSHWEEIPLRWLAQLRSGDFITASAIEDEGEYPVFGGNGLRGYTSSFTHDGEFPLIGRQGALCGNVNYAAGKFWASEHAVVAAPMREANIYWVGELLRAMDLNQYSVSAAQPGLAVERIKALKVPVPPFQEQNSIAQALRSETTHIDALIEKKTRFIELLKEKRQALITQAVTKGLDPAVSMKDSGVEWIGKIPDHWEICRVKHVAKMESGHTPNKKNEAYWVDCNIPWVSLKDSPQLRVTDYISKTASYINRAGLAGSSARMLPKGTVVFTRDATVGLVAIAKCELAVSQHLVAWVPTGRAISEYLLNTFEAMTQGLESLMAGSTIKTIGMDDIKELVMPVPPIEEQKLISSYVAKAKKRSHKAEALVERSVELLKERRSALITAAVTGQIDLRKETT
jgi:type I restriction enzyme S subunit